MLVGHSISKCLEEPCQCSLIAGIGSLPQPSAQVRDKPLPPSQLNPNISQPLETLILRCFEKEPEKRYQNGSELAQALEKLSAT